MTTFTGGQEYDVTSVSFGIELAQSGDGTGQPLTVNLYANNGSPFPGGDWQSNLIATSGELNIPDQADTIFEVPITATVPAGTLELVMEVMTPDGTAVGNLFFIGSNDDPETGPSYISAADCGITDPTPVWDIGFPDMHIVMNVNGSCPSGSPTPTPTATASPTPRLTPTPGPRPTGSASGGYRYSESFCYCHSYCKRERDSHCECDCYCQSDSQCYRESYGKSHANSARSRASVGWLDNNSVCCAELTRLFVSSALSLCASSASARVISGGCDQSSVACLRRLDQMTLQACNA